MIDEHQGNNGTTAPPPSLKAAVYVRMSTEHQQYSTANQQDVIRKYAASRNIEIIRTYCDGGKSGLNLHGRVALQELIADVQTRKATFNIILVYDISRWGRFQDADESAYYEYICKRQGINVLYCAEQFENDGSPFSDIVKNIKRAMAGEYSRELSDKVFKGQCKLIKLGYRQGGHAGFGLRRMLVDHNGKHKNILKWGEHKSIQTDRVILVHGPKKEVQIVRWMYCTFVEDKKTEKEIAQNLNSRNIKTDLDHPWNAATVRQVLTNEKYIGDNVYNRRSFKLKKKHVKNPPQLWVYHKEAFRPIVSRELFARVQEIMVQRNRHFSNDELLEKLKKLYQTKGYVSSILIDNAQDIPCSSVYRHRFGSLIRAYQLIGYIPEQDYRYVEINKKLRKKHKEEVEKVKQQLQKIGAQIWEDKKTDLIQVNGEFKVSIVIARCFFTATGFLRWRIKLESENQPDISIVIRMGQDNETIEDFYLLPTIDMTFAKLTMKYNNGIALDAYRFDNLDFFFGMAKRTRLKGVA